MPARVLVVDDDEAIRTLTSHLFSRDGYEVETSVDGADAIAKLQETAFDLIILDLMMPRTDGVAVVDWISENAPPPRIIVVTAAVPGIVDKLRTDLVWKVMAKPFNLQTLLQEAKDALRSESATAPENPQPSESA
jgi:CheY-like chemotaxis protein